MGRLKFRLFTLTCGVLLAVGAFSPVRAQDPDDQKRAVARISLMDGQVSVRRGDTSEWVAGIINAPLMADDHVATAPNSRAEVQFDASSLIRIGGNAEIHLTQLEYGRYQMELAKGTVTYRIFRASNTVSEVDTPTVSVRPSKVGIYRISVNESGETEVTVRAGDVEVFTPKGSQWVNAGQTLMARGSASDPEFQIVSAVAVDEWDRWNDTRDRLFTAPSASARYIDEANSGVYGTQDLDTSGTWVDSPDYGMVWHPTAVGPGWAPYSDGRWVWEDWYGWTWVSYDPWGWAPYHYGRWFNNGGYGWCWYPGRFGFHNYWSPALVGWFGFGSGIGFGFGFGHVGWVPLAPFEVFHPWWGRGFYGANFGRNINITNVNITNTYRNARIAGGVSGMAAEDFRAGRFNSISHVSGAEVRTAGLVRGQMPIAPTAANTQFSNRQASFTPQSSGNQRFFSHQQASTPQRVPFAQQQRALGGTTAAARPSTPAQSAGRSFGTNERPAAGGAPSAARTPVSPESNTRPGGGNTGWRRFGEPAGQNSAPQAARNESNAVRSNPGASTENTRPNGGNTGWNRFGSPGSAAPNRSSQGYSGQSAPRYNAPSSQPRYNAPSNSAPRSAPAPSYSAPRSNPAPSYSAPRSNGGGGHASGGGGHSSGGGGHHR